MLNGKVILLCVLGGLAVVTIVIAVVRRSQPAAPDAPAQALPAPPRNTIAAVPRFQRAPANTPGQRLLAHSHDRNDYRMFVGVPPGNPTAWAEVSGVNESRVTLSDSQTVKLSDVTAYFVAYPGGNLLDHRGPDTLPFPEWVGGLSPAEIPQHDRLTAADLKQGQSLVRVTFGRSTAQPSSRHHYSTTLTNLSDRPVRVLKFAGYARSGRAFVMNTVTGSFFSADEFREWYGQTGAWIAPGQSVTDPNNYGTPPVLWAYYCELERGQEFLTGGVLE
jgi:hypothetical protein